VDVLHAFSFDATGARVVDDTGTISDLIESPGTVVWVDAVSPTHEELEELEREFELHPLALEDVANRNQRPKLEVYPSHAFMVVYANRNGDGTMEEVFVFMGPEWIVTVHHHEGKTAHFDIEAVRERYSRTVGLTCSVGFLVYVILDEVVDSYFSAVDHIEEQLSRIEDHIFDDADPERDERPIQQSMLQLRRDLLGFRRRAVPLRDVVLSLLRGEVPWVEEATRVYLQDVFDHLLRIADEIDNQRELIGNAVDAHLAIVSNQMNEIMKKMTSWGAILLGSTLIAGIYGMNFDDMPELRFRFGYYGALGSMALLTAILYRTFKKRGWL
jgi:magnesium transporter